MELFSRKMKENQKVFSLLMIFTLLLNLITIILTPTSDAFADKKPVKTNDDITEKSMSDAPKMKVFKSFDSGNFKYEDKISSIGWIDKSTKNYPRGSFVLGTRYKEDENGTTAYCLNWNLDSPLEDGSEYIATNEKITDLEYTALVYGYNGSKDRISSKYKKFNRDEKYYISQMALYAVTTDKGYLEAEEDKSKVQIRIDGNNKNMYPHIRDKKYNLDIGKDKKLDKSKSKEIYEAIKEHVKFIKDNKISTPEKEVINIMIDGKENNPLVDNGKYLQTEKPIKIKTDNVKGKLNFENKKLNKAYFVNDKGEKLSDKQVLNGTSAYLRLDAKDAKSEGSISFEVKGKVEYENLTKYKPKNPNDRGLNDKKLQRITWVSKGYAETEELFSTTYERLEPKIGTTASFVGLDKNNTDLTTLTDIVKYEDLVVGKEYTVKGKLMNKETEEPIIIDGEKVTGSTTFTTEKKDGFIEVEFVFDQSKLETDTVVVFEDLFNDEMLVAVHRDINDSKQTVEIPEVGTKASFEKIEKDEPNISTIVDIVEYDSLIPGKEYTVTGILMDKETGEPVEIEVDENEEATDSDEEVTEEDVAVENEDEDTEGTEGTEEETPEDEEDSNMTYITGETTFVPEQPNGTVEVEFTFDKSKLKTDTVVVFEDLYQDERLIAVHHDINDKEQTVEIPEIGTSASFAGLDEKDPNITTIVDVVAYEGLVPGKEYTVDGHLMDKETKEAIIINGEKVEGSTTFTPEKPEGTVEVEFTFDKSQLETDTIVVFEDLYDGENLIAIHHDINDKEQTVEIPEVETNASFAEREEEKPNIVTIVDVVTYENLIPEKEYTVSGVLMDKETEKPIKIDGKEVTGSTTFVAGKSSGEVEVDFTFDQNKLKADSVVIFEDLYDGDMLVAVHHDINDKDQTVDVTEVEVVKVASDTGKKLKGAEFTMYDLEGNAIDVQETNRKGIATFNIMDGEEVVIKETKAPQGYKINDKQSTQEVEAKEGKKVSLEIENERVPGEPLPKTATDMFNMLLIGAVLLIGSGTAFYFYRRHRLANVDEE